MGDELKYENHVAVNTAMSVAASLSGLMSALARSRVGMKAMMLERSAWKSLQSFIYLKVKHYSLESLPR
ncbi:hypothetical protein ACIP6T_11720 [Pantoea sp. NPDC088449]|uniref:hypothetical protein n=1 Tax=Pantoea sp. NPDC088449 TaxID=3364392 RepID=UPI003812BAC3